MRHTLGVVATVALLSACAGHVPTPEQPSTFPPTHVARVSADDGIQMELERYFSSDPGVLPRLESAVLLGKGAYITYSLQRGSESGRGVAALSRFGKGWNVAEAIDGLWDEPIAAHSGVAGYVDPAIDYVESQDPAGEIWDAADVGRTGLVLLVRPGAQVQAFSKDNRVRVFPVTTETDRRLRGTLDRTALEDARAFVLSLIDGDLRTAADLTASRLQPNTFLLPLQRVLSGFTAGKAELTSFGAKVELHRSTSLADLVLYLTKEGPWRVWDYVLLERP